MQNEINDLILLQSKRKTLIKAVNRLRNQAEATVRLALGFDPNADEAAREKLNNRAKSIAATALNGKGCEIDGIAEDIAVFGQAMAPLQDKRDEYEELMRKIVRTLPIWKQFAEGVRGLGDLGLAVIIAECGDLAKYGGPYKINKRLGLAPYQKNGITMSAANWRKGAKKDEEDKEAGKPIDSKKVRLSKEDWITLGYSPRRRAEIYSCVGDPLSRAQIQSAEKSGTLFGKPLGPYGECYVRRRERTLITHPDWSRGHSKDDAVRVMTKDLLRDLWCAWNGRASVGLMPNDDMPSQQIPKAA